MSTHANTVHEKDATKTKIITVSIGANMHTQMRTHKRKHADSDDAAQEHTNGKTVHTVRQRPSICHVLLCSGTLSHAHAHI